MRICPRVANLGSQLPVMMDTEVISTLRPKFCEIMEFELSFFLELASEFGKDKVVAQFRATARNHILAKALVEAGMKPNDGSGSVLEMSTRENVRDADVVRVRKKLAQ